MNLDSSSRRVGVVIVNWRGWQDSIVALETLFAGDYKEFDVVIVDNGSNDLSVEKISNWATGKIAADIPAQIHGLVNRRRASDEIEFQLISKDELEKVQAPKRLTIVRARDNGGFAAGNNSALRYLLRFPDYHYFWLLNNDAFPARDALTRLVERAADDPSIGMVGSSLIYAIRPDTVQALGGARYDRYSGRGHHIGAESSVAEIPKVSAAEVERDMDYVVGASMLVTREFLSDVGLMEEKYFLYFEEVDWAVRGKPGYKLGYARDSLVYHKAGGSTQTASRRSVPSSYYIARNRILFSGAFFPEHAWSVWRSTVIDTLKYALKARWSEARGFWLALLEATSTLRRTLRD